ncbi:DEAD/DEAH box helicase family protein [Enterococcus cecorum]|nr:DEAD/DEAH box helicase family protein [Enterococcus cecorum]
MSYSNNLKAYIKNHYTSDLIKDFYQPVLRESSKYCRVSGYFNLEGIELYSYEMENIIRNNGKIQYIVSKDISYEDFSRIKKGYDLYNEIKELSLAKRNEKLNSDAQEKLGNLAFMIAAGYARIKIAFVREGIFHDKFGLLSSEDETILFIGSVNETKSGMSRNYESISVDVSWDTSEYVRSRINSFKDRFDNLWNNNEEGVEVIEISDLVYSEIGKYQCESKLLFVDSSSKEFEVSDSENEIISFVMDSNRVKRIDLTTDGFVEKDRILKNGRSYSKYFEEDNCTMKSDCSYMDVQNVINKTEERALRRNIKVFVSDEVRRFISKNRYSIEQYKILGKTIKEDIEYYPNSKVNLFHSFSRIIDECTFRKLNDVQKHAAFYLYEMSRAANFSVPGSGKTAMILGVFAYLNRNSTISSEKIDRLLVIAPINAFNSWKTEFQYVFGDNKKLYSIDSQTAHNFKELLNSDFLISNLILVNYEALPTHGDKLLELIDDSTMLVFDEVHRIKNPEGVRAQHALKLSNNCKFKYVLSGTPLPNSYQDIYNFLHILYGNEYKTYFGWDLRELKYPNKHLINVINQKLYPFFWRTNKYELKIPEPDSDYVYVSEPSDDQKELAKAIFERESSSLARLIRLIQASTNPSLVNKSINYAEFMNYDDIDLTTIDEYKEIIDKNTGIQDGYCDLNVDNMISPKFEMGIKLVIDLVKQGKKVLVWGIYVDTLKKILISLVNSGINANLIFGQTPVGDRQPIIDSFKNGKIQVLVSNPQTLGESISLHKSVHDAVYFEYDFNLTHMLQSRDRIHRLGLSDNEYTRYHFLQTAPEDSNSFNPGYIDSKIYNRLKKKEKIMSEMIDNKNITVEYSLDEILDAIKIIDEERDRIISNRK